MNGHQTEQSPVAIITGASKGLGLVLANFLAVRGFDLIITARNKRKLLEAHDDLQNHNSVIRSVAGDVSDPAFQIRLLETLNPFGRLNILINNASTLGPLPMPQLANYSLAGLRRAFEINTVAPLALVQKLRPFLSTAHGLVINLSSDAAIGGYEGWGGYGASKAALDLISLTLANELRAEAISVVAVDPGDMRTDMHQDAFPGENISDRPLPEVTLPFWAWLLGQEPARISGQRFQAQSELWQVPA